MSEQPTPQPNTDILEGWIKAEKKTMKPHPKQPSDWREFMSWCQFYNVPMPPRGDWVADYLLELVVDGVPLPIIQRRARSIIIGYDKRCHYLDTVPIRAALELAKAQLSPNRVLN